MQICDFINYFDFCISIYKKRIYLCIVDGCFYDVLCDVIN
jgi:hypothetical protein